MEVANSNAALRLVEKGEGFVKMSQAPVLALTLDNTIAQKVERVGPVKRP